MKRIKAILQIMKKYWVMTIMCIGFFVVMVTGVVLGVTISNNEILSSGTSVILKNGKEFAKAIKSISHEKSCNYTESDSKVKKIVFGNYDDENNNSFTYNGSNIINDLTKSTDYVVSDSNCDLYYDSDETGEYIFIYIISDYNYTIYTNSDCSYMFYYFNYVEKIEGLNLLNISGTTNMAYMFSDCSCLRSLDISDFDTSEVTSMACMFSNCSRLMSLDVSNFNTNKVVSMAKMFYGCSSLVNLDLSSFDTSEETGISNMFSYCSSLVNLDLSNFNVRLIGHIDEMFYNCSSLENLDLSNFDTSGVTSMLNMFSYCSSLRSLDLSSFDTSKVVSMNRMFYNCSSLTTIYVGDGWKTSRVSSFSECREMFYGCINLVGENGMTYNSNMVTISFAQIDTPSHPGYLTGVASLYRGEDFNAAIKSVVAGEEKTYTDIDTTVTKIVFGNYDDKNNNSFTHNGSNAINGLTKSIDYVVANSKCDLYYDHDETIYIVASCNNIIHVNSDSSYMFHNFSALKKIENLNLMHANKAINMSNMFSGCSQLENLDVKSFSTKRTTDMSSIFANCSSLKTLDLLFLITNRVTDMSSMFSGCLQLTSLDLSGFNTNKVTDMANMFNGCNALTTIYASNKWSTNNVISSADMFKDCTNLAGTNGTVYSSDLITDDTYAKIDGGTTDPGYLTLVSFIKLPNANVVPYVYTGYQQTYLLTNENDLKDYCIIVNNKQTNTGTYTVTYKLKNSLIYHWVDKTIEDKKVEWIINPYTLIDSMFTFTNTNYTFTGVEIIPNINVKLGTINLIKNTDYTISCSNNLNAGTATIVITGIGNYTGNIDANFTIKQCELKKDMINISDSIFNYTGEEITPDITVKIGDMTFVEGVDYAVKYTNNRGIGTGKVTVTGKGNFKGTIYKTFTIKGNVILNPVESSLEYVYSGEEQIYLPSNWEEIKTYCSISGNKQTNAGIYTITISILDTSKYTWQDGTKTAKTLNFDVKKQAVELPISLSVQGDLQLPSNWSTISDYCLIEGNNITEEGEHVATVVLKDVDNYEWSDGTTESIEMIYTVTNTKDTLDTPIDYKILIIVGAGVLCAAGLTITIVVVKKKKRKKKIKRLEG